MQLRPPQGPFPISQFHFCGWVFIRTERINYMSIKPIFLTTWFVCTHRRSRKRWMPKTIKPAMRRPATDPLCSLLVTVFVLINVHVHCPVVIYMVTVCVRVTCPIKKTCTNTAYERLRRMKMTHCARQSRFGIFVLRAGCCWMVYAQTNGNGNSEPF